MLGRGLLKMTREKPRETHLRRLVNQYLGGMVSQVPAPLRVVLTSSLGGLSNEQLEEMVDLVEHVLGELKAARERDRADTRGAGTGEN